MNTVGQCITGHEFVDADIEELRISLFGLGTMAVIKQSVCPVDIVDTRRPGRNDGADSIRARPKTASA